MERYLKREQNELDHSERVWQEIPWRMFCLEIGGLRWFGSNNLARSRIRSFYERSMYFLIETRSIPHPIQLILESPTCQDQWQPIAAI
jgi:hypothetical protein